MEVVLIIVAVALVAAGAAVALRARTRTRPAPAGLAAGGGPARLRSDVRELRVGDVVNYAGGDYVVEGTLRLEEGGFEWAEHRLVDGPNSLWLSVEDGDDGLECAIWERGRGLDLQPGARTLEHDGVTYERDERGTASFTAEGSTGTGTGGRVEYADYAAGGRLLSFERYGDAAEWEAGLGRVVSEHELDIYPGSDGGPAR
ncbi:MAG TPA: DUF4178 domain-containing protein [Solirubrobacteraceae bacterium]